MPEYKNYPFDEIAKEADKYIAEGYDIYQKFTCEACGQRLTMDVKNTFFTEGACDKCGHVTNIKKNGCSYLLIGSI